MGFRIRRSGRQSGQQESPDSPQRDRPDFSGDASERVLPCKEVDLSGQVCPLFCVKLVIGSVLWIWARCLVPAIAELGGLNRRKAEFKNSLGYLWKAYLRYNHTTTSLQNLTILTTLQPAPRILNGCTGLWIRSCYLVCWENATGTWSPEARGAADHLKMYKMPPFPPPPTGQYGLV